MIRFLLSSLVPLLGLPWLLKIAVSRGWLAQLPSFLYETTWVVALFTIIIFVYLYRSGRATYFVQLYLLSMAVKLVAYGAYVLVIIMEDPAGAIANALYFLAVYSIFTALEIGFLYRRINPRTGD